MIKTSVAAAPKPPNHSAVEDKHHPANGDPTGGWHNTHIVIVRERAVVQRPEATAVARKHNAYYKGSEARAREW